MLVTRIPIAEYDYLMSVGDDIFDFAEKVNVKEKEGEAEILFVDEDQRMKFAADYSGAIVHYGMTPDKEEVTTVGSRMEWIWDIYFL